MKKLILLTSIALIGASASAVTLTCDAPDSSNQTIVISGTSASVTTTDTLNGLSFHAKYDPSYKFDAERKRYIGKSNGNNRVLIVARKPDEKGVYKIQVQGNEDSFWSQDWKCTKE
ncbi:MAG: hypothetical protein ACXWIU_15235 [Limisphaerales bacterium]